MILLLKPAACSTLCMVLMHRCAAGGVQIGGGGRQDALPGGGAGLGTRSPRSGARPAQAQAPHQAWHEWLRTLHERLPVRLPCPPLVWP